MSAAGELFVTDTVAEEAIKWGLLIPENETLILPEGYEESYDINDLPTEGEIEIESDYEGESMSLLLRFKLEKYLTEDGEIDARLIELSRDDVTIQIPYPENVDYIKYLNPILADFKDGRADNLTEDDVDRLMEILRAKVELKEKLISEEKYESIIYKID